MSKVIAIIEAVIIVILTISLFNTVQSMAVRISNLEADKAALQDNVTELNKKLQDTLPYVEANGQQVQLVNQPNTHNPTWGELKAFLDKDDTDQLQYVKGSFTCGDFAKRLHDNAELAGIRAGLVVIRFNADDLHAINCFYTTDKGMVYIDATNGDSVGYIEIGKEYGTVAIGYVDSHGIDLSYNCYEKYQDMMFFRQISNPIIYENAEGQRYTIVEVPMGIVKSFELYW
ncbi:MAG: hypothetical protein ABSG90_07930 [Dehalococcoidia bacterium]|jgi:hypothetical protein